jgi:ABC-2 type transport system permease protein
VRTFLAILDFELRLQLRSRLSHGILLLFFAIHLLTIGQVGIHLSDNELIAVNSAYLIFRTELVLSVFGMLPAMVFIVSAAVRDHERGTAELFYATPAGRLPFVLGRFAGGALCTLLVGLAGVLGTFAGTLMPWLDQSRLVTFTLWPFVLSFGAIVAPSLFVFCAFTFSVAAPSRSSLLAFAVAPAFVVFALVVNYQASTEGVAPWWPLLDPFAVLPVETAVRYWTVADLNRRTPIDFLAANRMLWLTLAVIALAYTCRHVRLELPLVSARKRARRERASVRAQEARPACDYPTPPIAATTARVRMARLAPLWSQLRLDAGSVFLNPLSAVVVLLATSATIAEARNLRSALLDLPLYPQTALMLGFVRYGLLTFVLILTIFYAGVLVHREQDCRVHEIVGASPHPDWLMVASKTLTLGVAVSALLLVSMCTSIGLQVLAGHRPLEPGVYLEGVFVYDGFYFYMLGVLAITIQVLSPGKWAGMVATVAVFAALFSLESLGLENLLYGFRIPAVVYSDMNGFGHFRAPALTLIAYWGAFCVLLLVLAHLLFARGAEARAVERVGEAVARIRRGTTMVAAAATLTFAIVGGWVYYNTHKLNRYETTASRLRARADYERRFGAYRGRPGPSLVAVTAAVDVFPEQRRLEIHGESTLRNNRDRALTEVVLSVDPRLILAGLSVPGAIHREQDPGQGFYRLVLQDPLEPGETRQMQWRGTRQNNGFVNSQPDNELVANGTFVELLSLMPVPAYDESRDLTNNADRRRLGLPDAAGLPKLGDPAHLNTVGYGVDARAKVNIVLSTSADQTAVAPGLLRRQWESGGRRYFEYDIERPIWPNVPLSSARYTVARDQWNGVDLEVYHDPKHPWNIPTMLNTAKLGLTYFSREFSPYPFSHFRIVEFPRYRDSAQGGPGTVPYSESVGFLTDLRAWAALDYATIHELAHTWWGGMAYGARMQGRQMLNETLAQYSTLMVFKEFERPRWLRQILAATHDGYLRSRREGAAPEQPLSLTEDQGNVSYNKGALAMFALQDRIGADKVHQALRSYLLRFGMKPPPFPTSRDLVSEFRAVAGPENQALITELFERIVLYDVQIDEATARRSGHGFDVTIKVKAAQFEADGLGVENEVPLDAWFDVIVFPESDLDRMEQAPLYKAKHRLRSGTQRIDVRVAARPAAVGVDPFHLMIDRTPANNIGVVKIGRTAD